MCALVGYQIFYNYYYKALKKDELVINLFDFVEDFDY